MPGYIDTTALINKQVAEIVANMGKVTIEMALGVANGLKLAGLRLQRESMKLAPVEFGNLRASAYTSHEGEGFNTVVEVGYTAAYALFVHEAVAMKLKGQKRVPSPPHKGRYWDPQGRAQAKFLEEPARRLTPELVRIVSETAKIKPTI